VDYGLDGRGRFPPEVRNFYQFYSIQTCSGAHPASYPMRTGCFSPKVKQPGREADHQPPSNVEIKNGGAIPPLPNTSSWRGAQLIKHRDNFTFTFT
jgi:hypothetical protein